MSTPTEADVAPLAARLAAAGRTRCPLQAIGAASAVAAKVAVETGFDALWVSGLEVSTALGLPDENVLGPRDLADTVLALSRTTSLPVIVDVDNAGGAVATARRFAGDLTCAGAAALCLEDSASVDGGVRADAGHDAWSDTGSTACADCSVEEEVQHCTAAAPVRF
ncbi:isocitrate lyase/phosphoenolpyruvate mutase family protein [Streptomyces sp. NPDC000133]|uniref:isocitrate lyase/phosphoenolpyruvate mutase family protein n=1 Tax=Streptomyces sp. NPDC000133 TaxID=3364535 RepID=UPI003675F14D